jgi:hypothetical protein
VIGKTTVKMASEFSFIKTEINTKVCGEKIIDTVKEHTGEMKQGN